MSSLVLTGDTSGQVTLAAPAVAGSNTLTLQAATATSSVNTLATALAYNWNGLTTNTTLDFTGLPAWVKRITVMFNGLSTSGANYLRVQIGAGSIETSGYQSSSNVQSAAAGNSIASTSSAGFDLYSNAAGNTVYGALSMQLVGSNQWVVSGNFSTTTTGVYAGIGGGKTTSGTLDRVRITTVGSTDTFDAGSVNIMYEG